jgi:hypothetical protein
MASIDWVGGLLLTGSMISFLIGVTWAGYISASSPPVLIPIFVGVVSLAATIFWERGANEPFLRLGLSEVTLRMRTSSVALSRDWM